MAPAPTTCQREPWKGCQWVLRDKRWGGRTSSFSGSTLPDIHPARTFRGNKRVGEGKGGEAEWIIEARWLADGIVICWLPRLLSGFSLLFTPQKHVPCQARQSITRSRPSILIPEQHHHHHYHHNTCAALHVASISPDQLHITQALLGLPAEGAVYLSWTKCCIGCSGDLGTWVLGW